MTSRASTIAVLVVCLSVASSCKKEPEAAGSPEAPAADAPPADVDLPKLGLVADGTLVRSVQDASFGEGHSVVGQELWATVRAGTEEELADRAALRDSLRYVHIVDWTEHELPDGALVLYSITTKPDPVSATNPQSYVAWAGRTIGGKRVVCTSTPAQVVAFQKNADAFCRSLRAK